MIYGSTTSQRDFPTSFKLYFNRLYFIDNWNQEQPKDDMDNEVKEDIEGWSTRHCSHKNEEYQKTWICVG